MSSRRSVRHLFYLRSVADLTDEVKKLKNTPLMEEEPTSILTNFKIPFDSEVDLLKLEDFLKIPENLKKMVSFFCHLFLK